MLKFIENEINNLPFIECSLPFFISKISNLFNCLCMYWLLQLYVLGKSLYCLDREGKMRTLDIDTTEALFKLALERKDYTEVMRMVRTR